MPNDSGSTATSDAPVRESKSTPHSAEESAPNTLLNALIGGVVGVVLSFVPFSPVLGGAVAGYLEGGEYSSGAQVGGLAGAVAFFLFVVLVGIGLFFVPVLSTPGSGVPVTLWITLLAGVLLTAAYTIGFGAVGGVLGIYLKERM